MTCVNEHCDGTPVSMGRCQTCYSYLNLYKRDRSLELILWPNKGHPLATTPQVCEMIGLSYRIVDNMIRTRSFKTHISAEGSGYARGWSLEDVIRFIEMYARSKFPDDLNRIGGVELVINRGAIKIWLEIRWPEDALMDWDGVLPKKEMA